MIKDLAFVKQNQDLYVTQLEEAAVKNYFVMVMAMGVLNVILVCVLVMAVKNYYSERDLKFD